MTQGVNVTEPDIILLAEVLQPPVRTVDVNRRAVIVNKYSVSFMPLVAAHFLVVLLL